MDSMALLTQALIASLSFSLTLGSFSNLGKYSSLYFVYITFKLLEFNLLNFLDRIRIRICYMIIEIILDVW